MHIRFVPSQGFAIEQFVPEADTLAYLVSQGISKPEASRVMSSLKASAIATGRARMMTEFIARHCAPSYGQIAFAEFFDRFRESLPSTERHEWTRTTVSRSLPLQHRTMPGTGNRKYVSGLSWR